MNSPILDKTILLFFPSKNKICTFGLAVITHYNNNIIEIKVKALGFFIAVATIHGGRMFSGK